MDPTFRVAEKERTEDASQVADILARLVAGDWDNWPRDSGCGMLVAAGLDRDEALELWYTKVLPGRAYLGKYRDMVDYAVWRAQRTYDRVSPERGMFAAGNAAAKVSQGIINVWESRYGENGRITDKLDVAWASIPLADIGKLKAEKRAAAGGLRRMGAK